VRDALGDNEVAIEFLAAENLMDDKATPYYAALVLRKGWDMPKFVELTKAEALKLYYMEYNKGYSGIANPMAGLYMGRTAKELYAMIWEKLEQQNYIRKGETIFFAPDGLLHQINIEQLICGGDNLRAADRFNLYRVSSTREVFLKKEAIAKDRAALYGGLQYNVGNDTLKQESAKHQQELRKSIFKRDTTTRAMSDSLAELPATKEEVDSIAQTCHIYKVAPEIYSATAGNEESFKALSGKKTPILHIATHGFFFKNEEVGKHAMFEHMLMDRSAPTRPDNSLKRSGLIFAGAQRAWRGEAIPEGVDDGILLAEEIATMDLSGTDLVVLSACETGLGEITSEGVFGLQRAFKKAGVKTLIMSLWKVDDRATSLFMQTFYRYWLDGKSKHEAFALAQSTVRKHTDFSHPRYWAAFIMLDDYQNK
jgi:CHAT domain-containing protein